MPKSRRPRGFYVPPAPTPKPAVTRTVHLVTYEMNGRPRCGGSNGNPILSTVLAEVTCSYCIDGHRRDTAREAERLLAKQARAVDLVPVFEELDATQR